MNFHVLTLFPDFIEQASQVSILGRAVRSGSISVNTVNIRDFSQNARNRVDDYPYGGGAGMVMEAEPVYQAVQTARKHAGNSARVIYLTPQAEILTQTKVEELAREDDLILLCGHYEGIDERVLQEVVTDYISIGDYVLTGGELGAMVIIDAVSRFVPGVLHNDESSQFESLQDNLLEYPHYTRPEVWHDRAVPQILLSGDHQKIEEWRHRQSVLRTRERRPDLLERSYAVQCLAYGSEDAERCGEQMMEALSRYGSFFSYDRKKLQKQKRVLRSYDLLLLSADETETEISFQERLRNLRGSGTRYVLLYRGEDREALRRFLADRGFKEIACVALDDLGDADRIAEEALRIRKKY